MFRQARRLSEIICKPSEYIDFATETARCYLAAINCLSLVDPKSAWVALPASHEAGRASLRKRRRPRTQLPDEVFGTEADDIDVVELADIREEYMLVLSRLALAHRYPQHDIASKRVMFLLVYCIADGTCSGARPGYWARRHRVSLCTGRRLR